MITLDRWAAHAIDAWWFGSESAINVGLYVFENAATTAASQMVIARMFLDSASGAAVAAGSVGSGIPLVPRLGSTGSLAEL